MGLCRACPRRALAEIPAIVEGIDEILCPLDFDFGQWVFLHSTVPTVVSPGASEHTADRGYH